MSEKFRHAPFYLLMGEIQVAHQKLIMVLAASNMPNTLAEPTSHTLQTFTGVSASLTTFFHSLSPLTGDKEFSGDRIQLLDGAWFMN